MRMGSGHSEARASPPAICQGRPLVYGETISFSASRVKSVQGETVVRVGVTESDKTAWLGQGPAFGRFQLVSNLGAAAGTAGPSGVSASGSGKHLRNHGL